ncbi:unnamed protein product [Dicrocoelium dendriticum]|nr:unnamed protein product [Dicrocoelium dendriticum]
MITEGVIVSFGVFIEDLLEEFGESMSATSWVGSFSYGTPALVTPISSFILNKLGCRITCMLGALISSVGCLAGSFCDSLLALVFTFGILSGIGFSLSMTAALVVVTIYFDDRRATATGLSIAGTGVGALVFAPAVEFLINVYSWRGTFMLMAGAVLHIAICGALMRPVETRIERRHRQRLAWLEHFAKESGMPTIVKSEDYLGRDVLGRIKLLRDRLLAPRKCFGRTHGVVRMPTEYRFEGNQRMHDTSQNVGCFSTHCIQVIEARDATSKLYTWSTLALAATQSQGSPQKTVLHNHFSDAKSVPASAVKPLTTV